MIAAGFLMASNPGLIRVNNLWLHRMPATCHLAVNPGHSSTCTPWKNIELFTVFAVRLDQSVSVA